MNGTRSNGLKAESDPRHQKTQRMRLLSLKLLLSLMFVGIAVRLVVLQVIQAPRYQALARIQYEKKFSLPATRGTMVDRNGNILVSNTVYASLAADPKIVGDQAADVAEDLGRIFGKSASAYLDKLQDTSKRFVQLERRVVPELARRAEAANLDGIVIADEPKRIYHYDDLAGALIGFTDIDGKGISGLELQFDNVLRGTNGSVVMQRDGLGRVRPSADYPRIDPINGDDVKLTLDLTYQAIVEEELKKGITANKADAGTAVVLNPKTGEILALAVAPCVNPNDASGVPPAQARNRIVSDVFEPGSVFKVVTASAAYGGGVVRPETRINAEHGKMKIQVGKKEFQTITDTHQHDWLTFEEAIEFSSNIVMAKVSKLIGPERLFREARAFGFGSPTGVDIPGEVRGVLKNPDQWSGTTLNTMSYGYEIGVTPLQIACAYAAVANNGILMKPYVLAEVKGADGRTLRRNTPQAVRRVIPEQVASVLHAAFEGTVERGTAMDVQISGLRIAGKTGTSRKYVGRKYVAGDFTASFVGYFPVEDPQVVCLVMLDNPRGKTYYGGQACGPVFRAIAERMIQTSARFSRAPIAQDGQPASPIVVPDVRTLQPALAQKILESHGLRGQAFGKGPIVLKQSPEAGRKVEQGETVTLVLERGSAPARDGTITIPDVRGFSIRRAMNRLVADEFAVTVRGSGVVVQQLPIPGQRTRIGAEVVVICEPRPLAQAVLY
jgi:cell division protein FtsI (penicillin-binding protein 3)